MAIISDNRRDLRRPITPAFLQFQAEKSCYQRAGTRSGGDFAKSLAKAEQEHVVFGLVFAVVEQFNFCLT